MTLSRTRQSMVLCGALALATAAGCNDADDDTTAGTTSDAGAHDAGGRDAGGGVLRVLVGAVADTDVALGAVIADTSARLFFCGGPSSYASATHWFQVALDAAGFDQTAADGPNISGELTRTNLHGELVRSGQPDETFDADLVRDDTIAGLYEGSADCGRVGLIVTQRATKDVARGQGACVGPGHVPQQVNPILPITLDDDATIAVEVVTDEGTQRARVHVAAGPSNP